MRVKHGVMGRKPDAADRQRGLQPPIWTIEEASVENKEADQLNTSKDEAPPSSFCESDGVTGSRGGESRYLNDLLSLL
jgi:hypothetical protein